jgi:hypothetical protein
LKGCGFQPYRKSRKINLGFSRCGLLPTKKRVFPQHVKPRLILHDFTVRLEAAPFQNIGGWPDLEPSSMLTQ